MNLLITGGAGFLGINLVRHLIQKDAGRIVVLDFADFDYPDVRGRVTFIQGDIRDRNVVARAMEGVGIVIHTAAALPLYSEKDIYTIDVDGTRNLLDEALRQKTERFIHVSSTAVYGIPDHHPLFETDRLDGVGPYGKAKILAEEVCLEYPPQGDVRPHLRPKSFVGPERLGVFALFYDWAKDGEELPHARQRK